MKKRILLGIPAFALLFGLSVAVLPLAVHAHAEDGEESSQTESEEKAEEIAREQAKKLAEQRKEAEKRRLEALKKTQEQEREALKKRSEAEKKKAEEAKEKFKAACENRRESFKTRMENISERAGRHVSRLESITERVDAFKTTKNLTVENYDALLADVENKKALVETLAEAVKQQAEAFTCGEEEGEAKANLSTFKDALEQEIDALKAYKTSVKNLIVAVKTAAEQAEGTSDEQN